MSRFSGPQGKHAMRRHREAKRLEAADRQVTFDHAVLEHGRATVLARKAADREDARANAEIEAAFLGGEPLRCAVVGGAA